MAPKNWFSWHGLDPLADEVKGKTVLEIGCARGAVSLALHDAGAMVVHGVDSDLRNVLIARDVSKSRPVGACGFQDADLNSFTPSLHYDIVLVLAIDELKDPALACARYAHAAKKLFVVRRPKMWFDISSTMANLGFCLIHQSTSTYDDVTLFYRRNARKS